MADFKKTCVGESVRLTVAAGDSLLQWVLLPRLGKVRNQLPNVIFRILNLPTAEIVTGLRGGTIDIALVRSGGVSSPLQTSSLGSMTFSLFVPAQMLPAVKSKTLSGKAIAKLPLATLEGAGQFRQELERVSRRKKLALNIQLDLLSFPLVARAVQTGAFAAILPSIASVEFAHSMVLELKPDPLRPLNRRIVLAWNPRMARIRAVLEKAIPVFRNLCQLQ